ncbi:MAG: Hsp20/alpha crystallin family protein [Gammaproteobacteria bacterium]|nr:Hsp20/alpha crystallin family protein [Gammaproteobacteria bacterium]
MTTKRNDILDTTPKARAELTPFGEMGRLFDTMLNRRMLQPFHEMFPRWPFFGEEGFDMKTPRVDVLDRENEILVRAELPGVEKKDLDISLSEQTLTIKGETSHREEERNDEYYRSEVVEGKFGRTIRLPDEVDGKHVKADFKDGMLEVHLPKTHKAERHRIDIE